ncbi:MAG: GNAT family N-acetyltransferase [Pseudomonadota bacterium]
MHDQDDAQVFASRVGGARPANTHSLQRINRVDQGTLGAFEALVEDDRAYFRAASRQKIVEGWRILLPGPLLPPSKTCLVEPAAGHTDCPAQVAEFCRSQGFEEIRFYLPGPARAHQSWPAVFQRAQEAAMCGHVAQVSGATLAKNLTIRALEPGDYRLKAQWLEADAARPDGKAMVARDYVAMENAKANDGYMTSHLILDGGTPIGAFGISLGQPNLVRIKNLLLAKEYRGRGLGSAAISFASQEARRLSRSWIGAFALSPGPALKLYESHGMKPSGIQTELIASLALIGREGA